MINLNKQFRTGLSLAALVTMGGFFTGGGCPSSVTSDIEAAQFALDQCDPTDAGTASFCQDAVDRAEAILAGDPDNVEAALLASSGHLGLSGVDFLQFTAKLVEVQNNAEGNFKEFRTLITDVEAANSRTIDLTELAEAISILDAGLAGEAADTDLNERAFFQLGAIQSIDTFTRPVKLITFEADGDVNPDEINDDVAEQLRKNFLDTDNNLTSAGVTDEETLSAAREGYCLCVENSPTGYGAKCVRDLMRCELSDTGTEDTEQDYDGDAVTVGDRTGDCDALTETNAAVETCKDNNTE